MQNRNWQRIRVSIARGLVLAAFLTAVVAGAPAAQAQATGAVDIDITLGGIVILHYFGNIDVTLDGAALGNFMTGTAGDSSIDEGVGTGTGFTPDLTITPSLPSGNPAAAVLTLDNAWTVRSITSAATTQTRVSVTLDTPTLTHAGGDTITINTANVSEGVQAAAASVSFPPPGLTNPLSGRIVLTLDLSNATVGGDYLNGQVTLTAENI